MAHCGCRGECTCIIRAGSDNVHVYGAGGLDDPYLIAVDDAGGGAGGAVTSVNGETGAVTLTAGEVGASPVGHTHPTSEVTSGTFALARLGTGTPASGKYVDGGTGAWTTLPAGGGGGGGLPAGIGDPGDYAAVDGAVINAGTSTTGFFADGSVTTDTLNSLACVRTQIQTQVNLKAGLNITSQSTTGQEFVLVDFAWAPTNGMGGSIADLQHLMIADGTNLSGTRSVVVMPLLPRSVWVTLAIPVGTLGDVESIGVLNDGGYYQTGGQAIWNYWRNIRWANQTEADVALQQGAVLISPTYTPGITPEVNEPLVDKTRVNLDPDVAWIDGFGGVRHIREWAVPEDGLTECSARIAQALAGLSYGQTLVFPSKGLYWVDYPLRVRSGTRIEFNGATLFTRVWRGGDNNQQDPMIEVNGQDITLVGPHLVGYREPVVDGSAFATVAGTPTNSSTTKLLDAQGESVHYLTGNAHVPWYARYPLVQFPPTYRAMISTAYPTFRFGNAWVFTLSDSTHVTNDCVLEVVNTTTGVVYTSRTITLTATPTEYVLAWEPTDLEAQPSIRVRKATATANTITLTSARLFGYTEYNINHDSANAIVVQNAQNCVIEDFLIEGAPTDAIDSTSTANQNNIFRNGVSRACSRQGVSANLGSATFENILIIGANRSGVDIEPYGLDWLVDGLVLRDMRIIGCENWGIAMNNWAGIANITLDGIVTARCLVGGILGGGRGGTITNVNCEGAVYISGQRLRGGNITCGTFSISAGSSTYAPTGTSYGGQTTAPGTNSNVIPVSDTTGLSVGQRIRLLNITTADPVRKITAINGLNVTIDGDPVSWSQYYVVLYEPSVVYTSQDNGFTGITITGNTPPNVTGANNKVSDVRGLGRIAINTNLAVWEVSTGALGVTDSVRDIFTREFGRSFPADRSSDPPFIYGGLYLRGQALSGLKGISGDRKVTTVSIADATAGGGRGTTSTIDLGVRGLTVQLHLAPWVTGTGTILSVSVEVSQNNSDWYTVGSFQDANNSGLHDSMMLRFCERYVRARYFLSGASSPAGALDLTAVYSLPTNNTSGTFTGSSSTSQTVVFPSKGGSDFSLFDVSASAVAGSLTASTTYYYRIGARTREAGPVSWLAQDSVALGAGQTAVTLYVERYLSQTIGRWVDGISVLRGTSSGTYTTRYDIMAKTGVEIYTMRSDGSTFIDKGTSIVPENPLHWPDMPTTYPTVSPVLTVSDETGWEVDNTYRVFTMPAYTSITKRANGFDVTFASALTTFDWFIVR